MKKYKYKQLAYMQFVYCQSKGNGRGGYILDVIPHQTILAGLHRRLHEYGTLNIKTDNCGYHGEVHIVQL